MVSDFGNHPAARGGLISLKSVLLLADLQNGLNMECGVWVCSSLPKYNSPDKGKQRGGLSRCPMAGNSPGSRLIIWRCQCSFLYWWQQSLLKERQGNMWVPSLGINLQSMSWMQSSSPQPSRVPLTKTWRGRDWHREVGLLTLVFLIASF